MRGLVLKLIERFFRGERLITSSGEFRTKSCCESGLVLSTDNYVFKCQCPLGRGRRENWPTFRSDLLNPGQTRRKGRVGDEEEILSKEQLTFLLKYLNKFPLWKTCSNTFSGVLHKTIEDRNKDGIDCLLREVATENGMKYGEG